MKRNGALLDEESDNGVPKYRLRNYYQYMSNQFNTMRRNGEINRLKQLQRQLRNRIIRQHK